MQSSLSKSNSSDPNGLSIERVLPGLKQHIDGLGGRISCLEVISEGDHAINLE